MTRRAPAPPAQAGEVATPVRGRLLELLRRNDNPLDGYELSAASGLHITTVRFHLDKLAAAGLITVRTQARSTPGRPRTVYAPVTRTDPPNDYQALAALLADHLGTTSPHRGRVAEQAGQEWAVQLIAAPQPGISGDEAAQQITELFAQMKFDPELATSDRSGRQREIRLRGCPYRDVARTHPDVVCSVHLGLLRGALTRLGAPPTDVTLTPFVEPELCLAQLTTRTGS